MTKIVFIEQTLRNSHLFSVQLILKLDLLPPKLHSLLFLAIQNIIEAEVNLPSAFSFIFEYS